MDKEKEINHKLVQTYAEDMAQVLADDKSGLVKKIIHGEEEHEKEKRNLSPESAKNRLYMIIGLLFILLGLGTLFFFFGKKEAPTIAVERQFVPLIFSDASTSIDIDGLTKEKISQAVANAVLKTEVKAGGVEGIYLVLGKRDVGLREFTSLIQGNFVVPGSKLLVDDRFLMGALNTKTGVTTPGGDFFMLLKMRSLTDIFDAMRSWEAKMFFDLQGFFGIEVSSENKYLLTADFEDGIIENKNARILYDKDKEIVMLYIFADDNSVVITSTEAAAREIMTRLAASQIKK